MGEQFKRYYPGSATLEETARACKAEVINGRPKKLKSVEGIIHEKEDGTSENLNEASFEEEDSPRAILRMLNDFVIVDVSTPQGVSNAAAASNGRTNIGGPAAQFNIWVQDQQTPVQILGKHV
jgi:hypothetical protein